MCKQWTKFISWSPSQRTFGGWVVLGDIVIKFFDYSEQKGCLEIFMWWLWERNKNWRGPSSPPIFWSQKLKLFVSFLMSPLATF
jgi:hypothetical protein